MIEKKINLSHITVLQSFGIFLVVLGHSLPERDHSFVAELIMDFIYSFHMPLFMAISGYLFFYSGGIKNNYLFFLKNKLLRLLFPYILFSTIAFFPKAILSKFALRPIEISFESYIKGIIYPWDNPIIFFWFLPTLFIIFLLSPILTYSLNTKFKMLFITFILTLLTLINPFEEIKILNISGIAHYLFYFWLGILACKYSEKILSFLKSPITFFISLATLITISILISINDIDINLVLFSTSIIGIIMSFSFANQYLKIGFKFLNKLNGYSSQIYFLSWFFQTFFQVLLFKLLHLNYFLVIPFMFLGGVIFPIVVTNIIKRYFPVLSFTIGLKSRSKKSNDDTLKLQTSVS